MTHKSFTTVHDIVLYSCHSLDLSDSISQPDFTEPKVHFIILREGRLQETAQLSYCSSTHKTKTASFQEHLETRTNATK